MATQPRFDTRSPSTDGRNGGDGGEVQDRRYDTVRVEPDAVRLPQDDRLVRDLLKQLASEGGDLVRSEMALARLEVREMAREMALGSAKVGGAIALALAGSLALMAAAIIGLGYVLGGGGGMYALAALIVGAVVLLVGGVLARSGMQALKNPPKPEETARTMKDNRAWAAREAREFKEEIRS
jgi:hypothetical protein